jgi:hypothetical protein|tara:strand:+ start:5213 stop:6613 length:1401 start_codon:yes stop_codon:yes gene_type:complete
MYDFLRGLRILHYLSPVRFDTSGVFQHEFDSNYKAVEKTISFLPKCHHYVVVPTKHRIPDVRDNVTFLKYPYSRDLLANRSYFDGVTFRRLFDFRYMDFDFVFCHQPEMLFNILVSFNDKRYGQNMNRYLFFHWVDCPQSRASSAIPPAYMRQLEAISMSDHAFFHTDIASDWLMRNFKNKQATKLNIDYVRDKSMFFPLSSDELPKSKTIDMNYDKVIVFNHRWVKSTGVNRLLEYMEGMDEYKIWCTDYKAPKEYVASKLDRGEYRYLLENSLCSVSFVDKYATWNLSVQDGLSLNKPVLIYDHPSLRKVVGDNYPFYFKTKEEFQSLLRKIDTVKNFEWKLTDYNLIFENNLVNSMKNIMSKPRKHIPKDALNWLYCILNGINYKHDIAKQIQPNIQLNSVWQYIRRYLLEIGIEDNINSPYVNYSVPENIKDTVESMVKDIDLIIKPTTIKRKIVTKKHTWF